MKNVFLFAVETVIGMVVFVLGLLAIIVFVFLVEACSEWMDRNPGYALLIILFFMSFGFGVCGACVKYYERKKRKRRSARLQSLAE